MMRQLEISLAMQATIENSWNRLEQEDWLLIEEKALERLVTADLAVTVYLSPLVYRTLAEYIGFEEAQMDHAVFEAASWVLGRPAFAGLWLRRDTETFHFEDSIEEMQTPKLPLRVLLEQWSRRDTETSHLDDSIGRIRIPKPPSSPLLSSRPEAVRRRLRTLQRRH
jgi:hypothetical protein